MAESFQNYIGGAWRDAINVRDFIQANYTPYDGDDGFLAGPTPRTQALWHRVGDLLRAERARGGGRPWT